MRKLSEMVFASQADELKVILEDSGWDVASLATESGVNTKTLNNAVKGWQRLGDSSMTLVRLAYNRLTGQGSSRMKEASGQYQQQGKVRWIPVISWAHAGAAASYEELPKDWQDSIPVPDELPDAFSFAVTLEGDSMEPLYKAGDRVIVMPNIEPRNGCLVIAKLKSDGVVFKLYHQAGDGKPVRLTSYSPHYPPMDLTAEDLHWIYPVHSVSRSIWR